MSISHHQPSPDEEAAIRKFTEQFLGSTKRTWPNGRLGGEDDGETAFAIAVDPVKRVIIIRFPKPMDWIGFGVTEAIALRDKLDEKINELSAPKKS